MDTKIHYRIEVAHQYIDALKQSFLRPWLEQYEEYLRGELSLAQAMSLAHPEHYSMQDFTDRIRGPRAFAKDKGTEGLKCAAIQLWGYECHDSNLVADHLFPYSLGGPTESRNKLLLCQWHNTVKSSDIHFYPWERGEPDWLRIVLSKIANVQR